MVTAQFVLALVILAFTAYLVAMNWGCVIVSLSNKRKGIDRHHSTVPLVSVILAGIAYAIYPYPTKNWIGIFPLIDIGNWRLLLLPFFFKKWLK